MVLSIGGHCDNCGSFGMVTIFASHFPFPVVFRGDDHNNQHTHMNTNTDRDTKPHQPTHTDNHDHKAWIDQRPLPFTHSRPALLDTH